MQQHYLVKFSANVQHVYVSTSASAVENHDNANIFAQAEKDLDEIRAVLEKVALERDLHDASVDYEIVPVTETEAATIRERRGSLHAIEDDHTATL